MWEIWANQLLPKALKRCPKSKKMPDLVTLLANDRNDNNRSSGQSHKCSTIGNARALTGKLHFSIEIILGIFYRHSVIFSARTGPKWTTRIYKGISRTEVFCQNDNFYLVYSVSRQACHMQERTRGQPSDSHT